jgi:hypothetical protein
VFILEGENCVNHARQLDLIATTSTGGAGAPAKTDWQPLAGKELYILPDNDVAGEKYAALVARLCHEAGAGKIYILRLPGLPEKGDLVDWVEAHGDAAEPMSMRAEIEALVPFAEPWRAVEPPSDGTIEEQSYRPFPVEALPEPVRRFVDDGARAIGYDASYLALPLLCALAGAIGNTRRLWLKNNWWVPPILWSLVVGESGTAKTPAFLASLRPVWAIQQKALARHVQQLQDYEAVYSRWKKAKTAWERDKKTESDSPVEPPAPKAERYIINDVTVEALAPILCENPRGILLARDELAGWFGSFDRYVGKGRASSDVANWLSMFNAQGFTIDRKTGFPKIIHVPQAAVCIVGGIQPAIFQRALTQEHRESGLAARFLLAYPPRVTKQWTEADLDPNTVSQVASLFERLYALSFNKNDEGKPQPALAHLTPQAKDRWIEYFNHLNHEQVSLSGDLAAAWSKLEEYPARLALVIHYIRWANGEVSDELLLDRESLEAGITLVEWFKREAQRVYAMLSETECDRDDCRLREWIEHKGGCVTSREVQQGCRWLKDSGAAEKALEKLVGEGRGTWESSNPGQRRQPTRRFRLSPNGPRIP